MSAKIPISVDVTVCDRIDIDPIVRADLVAFEPPGVHPCYLNRAKIVMLALELVVYLLASRPRSSRA
ncbi:MULTISPECIES: hypothetical protein [Bradyrhizobium]|uniref:hypothetical protein n=1 Tax=Bradyrhizobium TaxID=374 RepID=UPI00271464BB|nr:hypothetical protein [Bradyrhizobium elkanii]WLA46716.1 hypothetical protein QIH80_34030 [Bradyrhizobium elkanii]WLB82998.1 hypothetical protein QIH83_10700 [Bradyrhizobium elkanii]